MSRKWHKMPVTYSILGVGGGNYVLKDDGIRISYQPWKENPNHNFIEPIMTMMTGDNTQSEETALRTGGVWRILKGDWRKEYEKLFPDVEKCIAFYKKMKPKYGFDKWSTDDD